MHSVGLIAAAIAIPWLLTRLGPQATAVETAGLSVYAFGLLAMLTASALYNLARPSRLKEALRRLDHAMIFVMIAGSYTPFALSALRPELGVPLCAAVWGIAGLGIALKLLAPRGHDLLFLALYIGMGWLILGVFRSLLAALPGEAVLLLVAGGALYSLGSLVHAYSRIPFHNALWHAIVVLAAALHLAAIAEIFGPERLG